jgi:hypothetical protein
MIIQSRGRVHRFESEARNAMCDQASLWARTHRNASTTVVDESGMALALCLLLSALSHCEHSFTVLWQTRATAVARWSPVHQEHATILVTIRGATFPMLAAMAMSRRASMGNRPGDASAPRSGAVWWNDHRLQQVGRLKWRSAKPIRSEEGRPRPAKSLGNFDGA